MVRRRSVVRLDLVPVLEAGGHGGLTASVEDPEHGGPVTVAGRTGDAGTGVVAIS